MSVRRSYYQSFAVILLALVCTLCFSSLISAAGRGKKGKPEAAEKRSAGRKAAEARKAEPKKAGKAQEKNARDKNSRGRDKGREERLAKDSKAQKGRKGARQADDEKDTKGRLARAKDKTGSRKGERADSRQKLAEVKNSKNRNERADKRLTAKEKAEEKKADKGRRSAIKPGAKEEKPARGEEKSAREEKSVPDRRATLREKDRPPVAEAQSYRKGKFGKRPEPNEAEEEPVEISIQTTKAFKEKESAPVVAVVPDRIEVIEYDPGKVGADYTGAASRPLRAYADQTGGFNVSSKRLEVRIDPDRITQIQEALVRKGFLTGAPTGVWDDATYDAMKRYQISQRIDATGYPTAHSLKRLGL
ncbi:MAG TPA: peptidoglycan-binding protein [Blastocatellia bacterium]|nr:peptidoglycan-binding protein [Blastocatellia bacterium]